MSDEQPRYELARQVVVGFAAGLAAGYSGPLAGAAAAGAAPIALAGIDYIASIVGPRRIEHGAQVLTDGADEFGAQTSEEFLTFIEAAASDEEHQELLARALTIAQDTAMRDKRRALGRALASAASDTGTKVDDELLFIRVLADLDAPHIRLLRLMATKPQHLDAVNRQMEAIGRDPIRQWHPSDLGQADPGLADVAWSLLPVLNRHGLISGGHDVLTNAGHEPEYMITGYGEWLLTRLGEPEIRR